MIEHEHDKVQSQTLYDLPCDPVLNRYDVCAVQRVPYEVFNLELASGLTTFDASGGNQDQFNGYCDQKIS